MYQQLIIVGNLGRDPEMRYTASGVPVTNFTVAVNRVWTGQDGQRQEKTTWFRVAAWRQLAERCGQYLTKGQKVMVIGELDDPNVWTDQQGNARASLEMTARDVRFLSSRDEAGMGGVPSAVAAGGNDDGPALNDEDIPF